MNIPKKKDSTVGMDQVAEEIERLIDQWDGRDVRVLRALYLRYQEEAELPPGEHEPPKKWLRLPIKGPPPLDMEGLPLLAVDDAGRTLGWGLSVSSLDELYDLFEVDDNPIHERIKVYRLRRSLTQEQAANQLEVSPNTWARWERGEMEPGSDAMERLEEFLGAPLYRTFEVSLPARIEQAQRAGLNCENVNCDRPANLAVNITGGGKAVHKMLCSGCGGWIQQVVDDLGLERPKPRYS